MAHNHHNHLEHGHHHHHHHHAAPQSLNSIFILCIILNIAFVIIEAAIGWWQHSLSLLSDAGHNLSDVLSLVLVLIAFHIAKVHSNQRFTYGYKKSTILISLLNAILLLVAVGAIIVESIHKFIVPAEALNGSAISWTAGAGIIINGATALLLMRSQKNDLNVRGAYLHMAADTLVSVGVLISGIIIYFTGWTLLDPIISLVIAGVILVSTWELLHDSVRLSLDGMPENISMEDVNKTILQHEHVRSAHHIHVWAISTTDNALTAHVVIDDFQNAISVRQELKHALSDLGIAHSTIEIETEQCQCTNTNCDCE